MTPLWFLQRKEYLKHFYSWIVFSFPLQDFCWNNAFLNSFIENTCLPESNKCNRVFNFFPSCFWNVFPWHKHKKLLWMVLKYLTLSSPRRLNRSCIGTCCICITRKFKIFQKCPQHVVNYWYSIPIKDYTFSLSKNFSNTFLNLDQ